MAATLEYAQQSSKKCRPQQGTQLSAACIEASEVIIDSFEVICARRQLTRPCRYEVTSTVPLLVQVHYGAELRRANLLATLQPAKHLHLYRAARLSIGTCSLRKEQAFWSCEAMHMHRERFALRSPTWQLERMSHTALAQRHSICRGQLSSMQRITLQEHSFLHTWLCSCCSENLPSTLRPRMQNMDAMAPLP